MARKRQAFDAHLVAQLYRKTGNPRAVQLLLGHAKIETTVRYLGVEVDDALRLAEQIELWKLVGAKPRIGFAPEVVIAWVQSLCLAAGG